jgi:peptidoglycan-binding protein ArfA
MPRLALLVSLLCVVCGGARAADPATVRFVVYFQEWSAAIDDSAQDVITRAAEAIKAHPRSPAAVTGFADPTGSKEANKLLSELRAQRVIDQLQTDGVPPARLARHGRGSVKFALTSQESRRVEVEVGTR